MKGKILNTEKHKIKVLSSSEIATLAALGCGVGEDCVINQESKLVNNLRYGKIVILTDADVDGAHYKDALADFFDTKLSALIKNGNVYIAQPP